eukprot:1140678-Pelagomonas_calceolata.AAC.2
MSLLWGQLVQTSPSMDGLPRRTPSSSFVFILAFVCMAAANCWALGTPFKAVRIWYRYEYSSFKGVVQSVQRSLEIHCGAPSMQWQSHHRCPSVYPSHNQTISDEEKELTLYHALMSHEAATLCTAYALIQVHACAGLALVQVHACVAHALLLRMLAGC